MHLLSEYLRHRLLSPCCCSDQFAPLASDVVVVVDQLTLTALFDPCSAIARFSNVVFCLFHATPSGKFLSLSLSLFFIFIFTFAAIFSLVRN